MLCSIIIHVAIEHSSLMRCQEVKDAVQYNYTCSYRALLSDEVSGGEGCCAV